MAGQKSVWIRVFGIVQGVGFRPFVSRTAQKFHILGSVCNKGSYVEILAQGAEIDLEAFEQEIKERPPERASILKMDITENTVSSQKSFQIIDSAREEGDIFVSPDIAVCEKCKKELFDKSNRRYLHPFINCTACGPRLTILDSMPYDRERTSMGEFGMCEGCHFEYTHASTRRYDAQPVCCNDCGPEVYLIGRNERGSDAITYTRKIISQGGIAAVKGIGGFHLCCDGTNQKAVERLRQLKNRPMKPFAVMVKDVETVRREAVLTKKQLEVLDGHQKPILLVKKRKNGLLCEAVAPENPKVGLMLPYAPVQLLLFTYEDDITMPDCLVMTSGNVSGAPIARSDEDALVELSMLCDVMLSHNRKIRLRADDSVMDFFEEKPYMVRRSRGYAPLPVMLSKEFSGQVLAAGGELKNTFCLAKGNLFYPSPYIGDMADVRTVKAWKESVARMETLLEAKPSVAVCDLHPKYNTRLAAEELSLPIIYVQHHYAHIVSCLAENDYSGEVIGVSFDGTGYGTDGTIWGGEFLKASFDGFERIGSVKPFSQAGGDKSSKEGWRIAVSLLYEIYGNKEKASELAKQFKLCKEKELTMQFFMLERKVNCVESTSAGRLFDGVSALLGIRRTSTFEGEASMALEAAADENAAYPKEIKIECTDRFLLPTDQLVQYIVEKQLQNVSVSELAGQFHDGLARMIVAGCLEARKQTGLNVAALSGGVFQNQLLLKKCLKMLREEGFQVLTHSMVPPNDGGICLGQAVVAMAAVHRRD